VGVVLRIKQDSGDKKAGKHEKQVDPESARLREIQECASRTTERQFAVLPEEEVEEKHSEHSDTADGIEFRHVWAEDCCRRA